MKISRAKLALLLLTVLALAAIAATGCSDDTALASPNLDSTPPAVPDGVDAILTGDPTVNLTWNANLSDPDLAGYVVYRSHGLHDPYLAVTTAVSSNIWVDESVQRGRDFYYRVASIDVNQNVSAPSSVLHVHVPAATAASR